ncbi:MAG: tetratricopeptide repeat protein, partial [Asticcacaulis sp.]
MNTKIIVACALGVVAILAGSVGVGWLMIDRQIGATEAKISSAVSYGTKPAQVIPAKIFGDKFLAGQNLSSALVVMGARYEYGVGVGADTAAAFNSFKKAAALGDPVGELMLGRLYDLNNTTPDQQHLVYKTVGDESDIANMREDNYVTDNQGARLLTLDDDTAINWYQKAAGGGNTAAMDLLGDYYLSEERTDGYAAKAVQWYQKSANLGDAAGEYHLGNAYIIEDGVSKNEDLGLDWLKKSAAQGYGQGTDDPALTLGMEYEQGPAMTRDQAEAAKWYKVSADRGSE